MRKPTLLITSLAAMLALGGCQSSLTGDTYSRDEARAVQTVRMGTIEALRPVTWVLIEDVPSGAWGVGGQPVRTEDSGDA